MTRSILRAIGVALLTAAGCEGVAYVDYLTRCEAHAAWERRQADRTAVVRDTGFAIARPGESLFVCERQHCWAFDCHQDVVCLCAPSSYDVGRVEGLVFGVCTVDHLTPSITDTTGACRYSRCDGHVGP